MTDTIREEYVHLLNDSRGLSSQGGTCVPAIELGEIVLARMELWGWTREELGARLAQISGCKVDSAIRRVYSTTIGDALLNDLAIADAMLLALDIHLDDTELPILPSSTTGAQRLVEAHYPDLPDNERWELEHALIRFGNGYLMADQLLGDEEAVRRAEHRKEMAAKKVKRNQALREENKRVTAR